MREAAQSKEAALWIGAMDDGRGDEYRIQCTIGSSDSCGVDVPYLVYTFNRILWNRVVLE